MNILIDDLPTDYKGYLINYTFRSGILISQCLIDESFKDDREKIYTALRILYGKGIPDYKTATEGLIWFINCGELKNDNKSGKRLFCFAKDQHRIFSAFMAKYGINLNKTNLHFFEFISLFNDLDKTAFRRVVDLRAMTQKEMKRYTAEDRMEIMRLKNEFAIDQPQEQELTKFDKLLQEIQSNAK